MSFLLLFTLCVNPFYEANFTSLPMRSISVFSNPAGLGFQRGAEIVINYEYNPDAPDALMSASALGNVGFGWKKSDTLNYYEAGLGYKLPGVFSMGYAFQFGEDSKHIVGLIGHVSEKLSLGFKAALGGDEHMLGGISIRPFKEYVTLSGDVEFEALDTIFNYFYGGLLQPIDGVKLHFYADQDFNWKTGLELSFGKTKIAGSYSHPDKKISGGILFSAQSYKTFIPQKNIVTELSLEDEYPELQKKTLLGIPISTKQGFTKLLLELEKVGKKDEIKVVLVKTRGLSLGAAQFEELKSCFNKLKKKGKKIIFFSDNYNGTLVYDLACSGDEIILSPLGDISIPGLGIRKFYLKNTLQKLGIEADITHVGKYKSAVEIFSREQMSDADREQLEKILDDFYYPIITHIAAARKKTEAEVEKLINEVAFFNSDQADEYGLVDTVLYEFELKDYINDKYGKMALVDFEEVVNEKVVRSPWEKRKDKIAVVIAEGSIVAGEGKPGLFQSTLIGGKRYAEIFKQIKDDKSIKAVVFRINSGGGDAFASEKIAYAVKQCAEEKPVIVSMGDVAGSGGYYIACLADKIFADDRTITGSIGVLGVNFVTKGLYDKLGISWDYIKRGKHSDKNWGLRHLTEEEAAQAKKNVEWWYDKFTRRVAEGRNMRQSKVDSLGQGRVYSGKYAEELGLIDETGGFLEALNAAKEYAHITGDVELLVYHPGETGFSFTLSADMISRCLYIMPEIEIK